MLPNVATVHSSRQPCIVQMLHACICLLVGGLSCIDRWYRRTCLHTTQSPAQGLFEPKPASYHINREYKYESDNCFTNQIALHTRFKPERALVKFDQQLTGPPTVLTPRTSTAFLISHTLEPPLFRPGDQLVRRRAPWVEPQAPNYVDVVFEDEDVLALNKPSGLQVPWPCCV